MTQNDKKLHSGEGFPIPRMRLPYQLRKKNHFSSSDHFLENIETGTARTSIPGQTALDVSRLDSIPDASPLSTAKDCEIQSF
ncbi:hypothetical protein AVEN_11869-1 [Araneus ventricosus]|uniref:Uncharacterized protein n=1 Tax=Araneus ventricosus TaxID=182803 RepID=A0A4Y2BX51_ARAVE|nr:hypothetical protein AVEN_11869-1 [Araneus ventricosus]